MGFSHLSTVGLCLFRIGDRAIKSLSTASDRIPCKTKSRLRTVFAESPPSSFVCENLSTCNGTISSMRRSPNAGKICSPGQSHSFFLWTASHLCAASKVSTKHPRKLLGSGLSLQASANMPRGFVLLRRHGRPSYRTVRTTSRLFDSTSHLPTSPDSVF